MKSIDDNFIWHAMSAYIDEIYVHESITSVACVQHWADPTLSCCKQPKWLKKKTSAWVLVLYVWEERNTTKSVEAMFQKYQN